MTNLPARFSTLPLVAARAVLVPVVVACGATASPTRSPAEAAQPSLAASPSSGGEAGGGGQTAPSAAASDPSPSSSPSVSPPPSTSGASTTRYDPRKFGFAAKGMSHEVMAFVTTSQVGYALDSMDFDVVSTVAFFSLEVTSSGHIAHDGRWGIWNSDRVSRLIAAAHDHGSKVVISLARFAWSPGQTRVSRAMLSSSAKRVALASEVAAEVARRGVDGVNVDYEPIPVGQK